MIPNTRAELKARILENLGHPVIQINVADEQIENCIDDALQFWSEFHHDAQDRSFVKIEITQEHIDNGYVPIPENIFAVLKVINPRDLGSNVSWMSYEYELTRDAIYGSTNGVSSYVVAMTYLAEMQFNLRSAPQFDFRYHKHQLHIFDRMDRMYSPGDYMIIECMGYLYKSSYNVWGDKALRRLAVAMTKKQWGTNLKKFTGVTLPSGVSLNGDSIYNDAETDIKEAEDFIMEQQQPLGIIVA